MTLPLRKLNIVKTDIDWIRLIQYSALVIYVLTAFKSVGHHQSDEHYQILEMAQYKLGKIADYEMPWEFMEQMRPSLQPYMAYVAIKFLKLIHISSPFQTTLILRVLSAFLIWFVAKKANSTLSNIYLKEGSWAIVLNALVFLLWYVPYISVRFSSENFAGAFLLLGLIFFLKKNISQWHMALFGLFLGLSFQFRYQMGLAIFGIFCWVITFDRKNLITYVPAISSFLMVTLIGVYLDYLFYGELILAPWNYFKLNLVEGRATDFGTDPFWFYIVTYLIWVIPPFSIFFLVAFVKGAGKLRLNILTWTIIPFLLVHFFISHKEMRFLFSVHYIFTFVAVIGFKEYFSKRTFNRIQRRMLRVFVVLNTLLILVMMVRPANEKVVFFTYLYKNIEKGQRKIITTQRDYYEIMDGLKTTFYTPENSTSIVVQSSDDLFNYLDSNHIDTCFYIHRGYEFNAQKDGYNFKRVFSVYPSNIKKVPYLKEIPIHTDCIYLVTKEK